MLASLNCHIEVVEMLLSRGAKVDLKDEVSMGGMDRCGCPNGRDETVWGDERHSGT